MHDIFVNSAQDAYALGLWCADGYWWSSSIGLSNVEPELTLSFADYLISRSERKRLKLRIYEGEDPGDPRVIGLVEKPTRSRTGKRKRTAYHVYVNSRPLLRSFQAAEAMVETLASEFLAPYFAGRFDGDGVGGSRVRIAYSNAAEAEKDAKLLTRLDVISSVLHYVKASEFCVYIHERNRQRFLELIQPWSWKLRSRVTL